MKKTMMAVAVLASSMVGAQDDSTILDDRWYAGIMGGVARPGEDRLSDSTEPYLGAYFGRFYSPNFSLDLQIDSYSTDFERRKFEDAGVGIPADFDREFEIYGAGLAGRYHLGAMEDRHRPYGLVGVGIQEHDNFLDDGRDLYASLGFGIQSKFGDHVRLRTQLEGRYDNDRDTRNSDNGFVDMIFSVGLSYSFGDLPQPPPPPEPRSEPARPAPPPPAPAPEPEPEPEVMFEFDSMVLFAFDSAELRPEARGELNRAADILAPRDDIILLEVAGHTDSMGDEDYNQKLSERRAQSVADYLARNGVDRDRMRVVGYGESRPQVPNDSIENRQQNRRVVLSILERRN
ncbi:MAG: OmpA family protein [Wenzhouxiangellaceae bacterium]|nr:OmpA family protein [Wenzhouxiangellaceae bacterium]MBS3745953.1 OmpA family protein [Wenzhouxiangellaceae bacterium]MBS3823296.1 OmpA family protein [Wenzhouxiangellaceae bacterium]